MVVRRGAQEEQGGVVRRGIGPRQVELHRFAQGANAALELVGHDPFELGLRALHRRRRPGQPQTARRQQADTERQRLVIGEHHRWQFEAGHETVSAVSPALGHHGNAQVFQPGDVAAHGASVHLQPCRQFGAAERAMGLQQLQHGQHTGGRRIHASQFKS